MKVWLAVLLLALAAYGVADELTQPFIGRTADALDYIADLAGAGSGVLIGRIWSQRAARPVPAQPPEELVTLSRDGDSLGGIVPDPSPQQADAGLQRRLDIFLEGEDLHDAGTEIAVSLGGEDRP